MIRTRFSPSPTGYIHLGNARAALFSAFYAVHEHGHFLLRIEDTDAARSEEKFIDILQDDLHWLGIQWQEGPDIGGPQTPYQQSLRKDIYDFYYQKLEKEGLAYPCFCTEQELALNRKVQLSRGQPPRYPGTCRALSAATIQEKMAQGLKPALRFKIPQDQMIEFVDLVKGPQKFNSHDIGDFIVRRADGSSSFMFCNAIDDSLMEVTHVIRGEDHLTNTPRQLMILKVLNMRAPNYGHLSLITGNDGAPLSKRHGSFSLHDLRKEGFLPLAVLNYMARLSHTYDENALFNFSELANHFQLSRLSRAPARFDRNQLLHWQKEAVLALDAAGIWEWLGDDIKAKVPESARRLFSEMMRLNILFPQEANKWADILFHDTLVISEERLHVLGEAGEEFFATARQATEQYQLDLKNILNTLKTQMNVSGKKLFMPVRIALTGEEHGPELVQITELLGSEKMQKRFALAQEKLQQMKVKQ